MLADEEQTTVGAAFPWLALFSMIAMDSVAILPAGLVGVLAIDLGSDLGAGATAIGLLISAYFLTGSIVAAVVGSHIDRFGPRRSATLTAGLSVAALALIAVPVHALWIVAVACATAGGAMSITMPSTNAILGVIVGPSNRMLAVCAKQAAVPIALAAAAATLPLASSIGGWRVIFAGAAAFGVAVLAVFRHCTRDLARRPATRPAAAASSRRAQRAVVRIGVSSMLASLLAGTLTGYAAISLHRAELSPALAASVLAISNAGGIASRLATGWWAQRRNSISLRPVSLMMIAGGTGAFLIAVESPGAVALGSIVAFSLGWGWSALTYAVVLEANLDNPGATGAVVQAGGMAGSGTGPLLMAGLVGSFGLSVGWLTVGCAAVSGGVLIWRYRPPSRGAQESLLLR
jgi:predicted MFS family arabinose efflux permease